MGTPYETAIRTDRQMIQSGGIQDLPPSQKSQIAAILLSAHTPQAQARRAGNGRRLYPEIFLPPVGGKRLKTIFGQTPKTQIFAANLYELEITRLLCLLAPESPQVPPIRDAVLERLGHTCFGAQDDGVGECFDTSLVVLRFLCAAAPEEEAWIRGRMENYLRHKDEKKRPWFSQWYYWLCLSEAPLPLAEEELRRNLPPMLHWLNHRSFVMHSEHDRTVHPVLACMLRNAAARLPEYAYIRKREPFVGKKDGRLHFDMSREAVPG